MFWYTLLVLGVAAERVVELIVARRNAAWTLARAGVEHGRGHYPVMVVLHTALLVCCLLEPVLAHRPFLPALGWPMLSLVLLSQALRWWCVTALGPYWNTRVIVVPGTRPLGTGPYRLVRHPNYVAVVVEVAALPLVHSAWLTAAVFSSANAVLLTVRLRCENAALTRAVHA
ncbi:isoprenylcysteine carboxyl methyltransferase family protein [Streptomyces roseolus]|uniref:isoprenylcysteine carboxyl methyltransferase family protein n=1 Tax=Streptomyces roseolus TaxID=67358 RepID=UPI0016793411|nr:isoprenylcysteine carboxylmethyltransferase family protein [Streptomyces roseolus]GGR63057.1 isoprenylcysteine carboxyl methyltransferase [Streptomyces roseolus]